MKPNEQSVESKIQECEKTMQRKPSHIGLTITLASAMLWNGCTAQNVEGPIPPTIVDGIVAVPSSQEDEKDEKRRYHSGFVYYPVHVYGGTSPRYSTARPFVPTPHISGGYSGAGRSSGARPSGISRGGFGGTGHSFGGGAVS